MIIWSGWGIIVPLILLLSIGLIQLIWSGLLGLDDSSPLIANLWLLISFALAGVLSWFTGKKMNKPSENQTYIHKQTGQEVQLKPRHSLFFIRIEYWGIILPIIGVIAYIAASTGQ